MGKAVCHGFHFAVEKKLDPLCGTTLYWSATLSF